MLRHGAEPTEIEVDGIPTVIATAPDGVLWICTQNGRIYKQDKLYLDLGGKLVRLGGLFDERGLLGLAFHPTITNRFYVYYNAPGNTGFNIFTGRQRGAPAKKGKWVEEKYNSVGVIEEYQGTRPLRRLLQVKRPINNHNGKDCLFFHPTTGKLLWANGDGGGSKDPFNLAQDDTFIHGKILAIDLMQEGDADVPISRVAQLPPWAKVVAKGIRNPVGLDAAADKQTFFMPMAGEHVYESVFAFHLP